MKKFVGIAVLAVMIVLANLAWTTAVLVPANACCRSHGAHHCADASESGEHAASAPCPHRSAQIVLTREDAVVAVHETSLQWAAAALQSSQEYPLVFQTALSPDGRSPPTLL